MLYSCARVVCLYPLTTCAEYQLSGPLVTSGPRPFYKENSLEALLALQ